MVIDQPESAVLIHKNNTNLIFNAVMFIKYRAGRVNETNNNLSYWQSYTTMGSELCSLAPVA